MIVIRVKPKADKPDDDDSASQAGPSTRSETAKKVTFEESTKVKGKKGKGKGKVDTVTEDDDDTFDSGFILSPLMPWTDHRLLPCLIGLSYLALDEEDWVKTGRYQSLRDILCPGEECKRIYRAQG